MIVRLKWSAVKMALKKWTSVVIKQIKTEVVHSSDCPVLPDPHIQTPHWNI